MSGAVDRLAMKLARVDVKAYLRKGEAGHVEAVKAHTRVMDLLRSGGKLPTLNLPTGPRTFSPEQLARAQLIEASLADEARKAGLERDHLGMVTTVQNSVQVGTDAGGLPVLKWKPEREKLHKEILDHFWEQEFAHVPSEGKAVVSGGIGGAGKSTILKSHADIDRDSYGTVNPDDIKEYMAEHGMVPDVEGLDPMEASALAHEESSYLAMTLAQRAYAEKKNLIWDITMSSPGSVQKRVDAMHQAGYSEIKGVFVDIPVELSVKRAVGRWWEGALASRSGKSRIGGRYVSPTLIRQQAAEGGTTQNRRIFESFENKFDSWEMWNTEGAKPRKVGSSKLKGRI